MSSRMATGPQQAHENAIAITSARVKSSTASKGAATQKTPSARLPSRPTSSSLLISVYRSSTLVVLTELALILQRPVSSFPSQAAA